MTKMKRKDYEKPAMRVVELQHRTMLLQASGNVGTKSTINNWGDGGTTDEDIYM